MSPRETVSPSTLQVRREESAIIVQYLDGRETVYELERDETEPPVRTQPGMLVQVLQVTDDFGSGLLIYVNDRDSAPEILEDTGVGRINLQPGESASLLPGIEVAMDGHSAVVDADLDAVDGHVFVFEEGMMGAAAYELVEGVE